MIKEEKFAETYAIFDRETVVEIIDIFINEYDERIEEIGKQIKMKDFENLHKSSHAFKGVISNFETECEAFEEISSIMNHCHTLVEKNMLEKMGEQEKEELSEKLQKEFISFKKHSRQMYNQLKDIRTKYLD